MNIRILSALSLATALTVSATNSLSASVVGAKPISQVAPAYSRDLRTSDVEGEVVVGCTITAAGDVANAQVVSSTERRLEFPTLDAVRKWKFAPAMKDGVAVSVKALLPVAFLLPALHQNDAIQLVASNAKPAAHNAASAN